MITESLHYDKLFPANLLSAGCDDNLKSCILNGERLSCPARNVVHLMTSDVNKWRDVTQNLRHPLFYLHFLRQTLNGICDKQIITWGFGYRPQYQPSTIISPRAKALGLIMGSQVDTSGGNQNAMR